MKGNYVSTESDALYIPKKQVLFGICCILNGLTWKTGTESVCMNIEKCVPILMLFNWVNTFFIVCVSLIFCQREQEKKQSLCAFICLSLFFHA